MANSLRRQWLRYATGLMAVVLLGFMVAIVGQLWTGSQLAWERWGLEFITRTEWNPPRGEFGALPFVAGTLMTSVMAMVIAVPISLGIAILLSEYAPRSIRDPLVFIVELLAAIPSVVFGLWGIFVLAPLMREYVFPLIAASPLGWLPIFGQAGGGYTLMTASVILAIMIIPIITSLSREVLLSVPPEQKEAALALGATRWEAVRHVVLSSARAGVFSAAILGLGRALGETMATTMTIGNRIRLTSDFLEPGYSMTAVIANELREAGTNLHVSSLIAVGLLLFFLSFALNTVGRIIVTRWHGAGT